MWHYQVLVMPGLPMFGEAKYIIQFVAKPAELTSTPSGPRDRWHGSEFAEQPQMLWQWTISVLLFTKTRSLQSACKIQIPEQIFAAIIIIITSSSSSSWILIAQQHLAWSALLPCVVREAASVAPKVLPLALVWNINTLHCLHGPHNGCSFYFRNLELSKHVTGHAVYSYGYQRQSFCWPGSMKWMVSWCVVLHVMNQQMFKHDQVSTLVVGGCRLFSCG